MPTRVVVVDDDEWIRRGRAQALADADDVEVVAALDHAAALARPDLWAHTDVVLVDAWDRRADFDRFPGVAVVRAVRAHAGAQPVRVVVVTGHLVNDMLRLRMAQAGADLFYGQEEVADTAALLAAVRGELLPPAGPRSADAPVRPEPALDWIREHGLEQAFSGEPQKTLPLSRRALMHIRREVGARARLAGPGRLPPWRQVVAFVNRARGAELRRSPEPDDGMS